MPRLSALALLAGWALGNAPVAIAQELPRVEILVYKYDGIESAEQQAAFNQFESMIRDKLLTLSEQLSERGADFAYLEGLASRPAQNAAREHAHFRGSLADLKRKWKNEHVLEVFLGELQPGDPPYALRSRIYLGELRGALPGSSIKLDLRIDPQEFRRAANSHTTALLYGLAMDAKRRGAPTSLVLQLLGEARTHAMGIERSPEVDALIQGIEAAILELREPSP